MGIRIPQSNVPSSAAYEAITKEMHDGLGRATTTVSSLAAKQGSCNISKTQTKVTPFGPSSPRTSLEGGPGCYFTIGDGPVQARPERLSNLPNEPLLGEAKHRMDLSTASQTDDDETLVKTLLNIKRSVAKDKGKAIMQESESPKKIKKKEMMQIGLDEEIAQRFYKEEQAQILRDEEYAQQDDVQAHIQTDEDFAQRMLEEEIKSLSIEERSRLLAEFIDKRKKMMATKRAEEKRNKPPTQAQQKTYMSNYLKNMGGLFQWKVKAKQEKEAQKKQEDVVAKQAEKESSKKAGGRLKRKTSKAKEDKDKRQKKQDDLKKLTLMEYVEVISDYEEADGSYKTYIFFSEMLNDFNREDIIVLCRLFNEKYASTRPGFDDLILWGDMKIMFEPDDDDEVWKNHHS
uniref:Uncharacterized protein n=1 Tax=Tanacetum cinerariifolium TaxID=118510 RepID=A0A6L2KD40_TANCI|nr:hypothetical protein [Tanacetum cinerariifolium]